MDEVENVGDYTIQMPVTIREIFEEIVAAVSIESELPEGATAGLPPPPEVLAAVVIRMLGKRAMLDGSHYYLCLYAEEVLADLTKNG